MLSNVTQGLFSLSHAGEESVPVTTPPVEGTNPNYQFAFTQRVVDLDLLRDTLIADPFVVSLFQVRRISYLLYLFCPCSRSHVVPILIFPTALGRQ